MRFLVDAQLPPALARWLTGEGHWAEHVDHSGLNAPSDHVIWNYAQRVNAVILTKDRDFAVRISFEAEGPQIVWIRVANTRKASLLAWFGRIFPDLLAALNRGEKLVELVGTVP